MGTDLTRIGERARKEPDLVFTSLYHHIGDVDNLRACYDTLEAKKATGVDGVTKEEYGKNLEENLRDLSGRDSVAPPRKQVVTEKTNIFLQSRKAPVYSNKICSASRSDSRSYDTSETWDLPQIISEVTSFSLNPSI